MDELNNGEQGQYVEPGKNEKKNNKRRMRHLLFSHLLRLKIGKSLVEAKPGNV